MDLTLDHWKNANAKEREAIARRLAKQLPHGFCFDSVQEYRLGDQQNLVALFQNANARFALIPGGIVSLGYDSERPWMPNPDELEDWQETAAEYEIDRTIQEYIADVTLRVRQVELSPYLIEIQASELGWEIIAVEDPVIEEILREHKQPGTIEVYLASGRVRIHRSKDGTVVAERALTRTHAELAAEFATSHFRFPTSDEWEFACGSGSSTLFRWGDHVPCDRYPTDISPLEAAWRREWVLSLGTLEPPVEGFNSDWNTHRQPNAFGLLIASDPYKYELMEEIGTTRGGDGGSMICGGVGFFMGWLPLAAAYFEEHSCKHDPTASIAQGFTIWRRVLDLR